MAGKLTPARKLISSALSDYWRYKGKLVATVALIAVPLAILADLGLGQDSIFSAYSSFLSLIMNLALIWLVVELGNGRKPTLSQAYYRGTASIVRFLLITAVFLVTLLPFLLGSLIYIQGVSGTTLAASGGEKLLLGFIWFLLSIPSIWLLSRFILSIYALVERDLTPIGALRYANKVVQGRTGKALVRYLVLIIAIIIITTVPALVMISLGLKGVLATIALTVLQLASVLILLPIINLYLFGLYRALDRGEG